ncbi:MAG: PAS domain S-box protein, partial [Nitrospirae bacterium]
MNKETHTNSRIRRLKRPQAPEPRPERLSVETVGPDEASMNMVGAVIEELQVAEEELRAQNEELATARQAIEAERERYKDLFEFAPDGYVVTDAAGIIREANRAASAMLNVPQHWLLRKPFALYLADAERKAFRARLSQVQGDKRIREWELHLNPHGRPPLPVALKVAMTQALPGTAIQLRWLLRDITQRKQTEEEWKRLNDQFRLLLESTGEGVYGIDLQGRCTFINKAAATTLGYRPEELYGKLMHQVHHH